MNYIDKNCEECPYYIAYDSDAEFENTNYKNIDFNLTDCKFCKIKIKIENIKSIGENI